MVPLHFYPALYLRTFKLVLKYVYAFLIPEIPAGIKMHTFH